jgi:short-subunit dehydrogenase
MAVLPSMRQKKTGRIVNISSIGGKVSVPHLVPYSASKFALVGLSKGLRAELMKDGIKVTTVCPGLMRTGSPRNADFKGKHRFEYAWFSISDALPLLTVSAENAARQVVQACKRGQAELVISVPAKIAVLFDSLFPETMSQMLALTNRLLPDAGGAGTYVLKSAFNRFVEYDLKDKTVLITGSSRGLGLVMAREFARQGSRLVLCARD